MRLSLCLTALLATLTACKTTDTASVSETKPKSTTTSEFICRAKSSDNKILHVNATLVTDDTSGIEQDLQIHWRLMTTNGAVYQSGESKVDKTDLANHAVEIKTKSLSGTLAFAQAPHLVLGEQKTPCTSLVVSNNGRSDTKLSASCNAIGTPSQGWYANGKLLKHSPSCNMEILACGTDQSKEGWYIQKKIERVRVASERCAWRKDKPVCKTSDGVSAWYLGERLVARDDECQLKWIECMPSPKYEGWFTFKRSDPQLLVASMCGLSNQSKK